MPISKAGRNRYRREYAFHQALYWTQRNRAESDRGFKPITTSAARRLRELFDEKMADRSVSIDSGGGDSSAPIIEALHETMQTVEGYQDVFAEGMDSKGIKQVIAQFEKNVSSGMVPVSPYDPRFSTRAVMKAAGHDLRFAAGNEIEEHLDGELSTLHQAQSSQMSLYAHSEKTGKPEIAGELYSEDDRSGLSELSAYMTAREYSSVRDHMKGVTISQEGLQRASAILDELDAQGAGYSIYRDRRAGQIKASIEGTKIDVRLTDPNESYIGRVYDDGVQTYYSPTHSPARRGRAAAPYTPSRQETVNLVRVALGQPVQRADGSVLGAPGEHRERDRGRDMVTLPDTYLPRDNAGSLMMLAGDYTGEGVPRGEKLYIRRTSVDRTQGVFFGREQPEKAESYLREAVETSAANLSTAIDADRLIAEHADHVAEAAEGEYFPEFSGDDEIAVIQRQYWDVLRGAKERLPKPGASEEELAEWEEKLRDIHHEDEQTARNMRDLLLGGPENEVAYTGTPADQVRAHAAAVPEQLIGSYDLDEEAMRFNPAQVAKHMTSERGYWGNRENLAAAIRAAQIEPDQLRGDGYQVRSLKDQAIRFDESSAVPMDQVEDDFTSAMLQEVRDAATRSGGEVSDVRIDGNGVVRYDGVRRGRNGAERPFSGEVGQIFAPGEHGEVLTRFASGEDYMMVPGYEARILPQAPGENLSVEERTRLRGYQQAMTDSVRYQVTSDMMNVNRSEVGAPASLNRVYGSLHDTRHGVDFLESAREGGLSEEHVAAILATEASRVRYPKEIEQGATMHADYRSRNARESAGASALDMANDNFRDPYVLVDGRNMAVMTEESDGYFDPVMTGSGTSQGSARFLVEGAEVDAEGRIVPSEDRQDRAALMKLEEAATMSFDPYDRQQMSASNLLNASAITSGTRTAMMDMGGWTFDDPVVVSKEFAASHQVRSAAGDMRDLVPGDKVSDLHGNKGVVSLVVDRDMDLEQAREQGIEEAVRIYQDNPDLDVVMSPFSPVSRFNGGTARELMDSPSDVVLPDGRTVPGGMGEMNLIVTHKDVESGTRVYGEQELAAGGGRKASPQLAWALGAQDCEKIMGEFYGPNSKAVTDFRETLVVMGLEMEPDGTLDVASESSDGSRHRFGIPELTDPETGKRRSVSELRREFAEQIKHRGGEMELPFPITMASGEMTPKTEQGSYLLPVMSSHLRSGQDLGDGVVSAHDYTNEYLRVFEAACKYSHAESQIAEGVDDDEKLRGLRRDQRVFKSKAQAGYDTMAESIRSRRFESKRNVFYDSLMSAKLPNSATAVWTADPRLEIDQLGMGPQMAESMGFSEGDHAMIWRDPVLRDAGVRSMRVTIDERLTGTSINPVMDKSFDGDFDGDSVGVVRLTTKGAQREAIEKLSVEANLLDTGAPRQEWTDPETGEKHELYPLSMQDSLEVKAAQHDDPELAQRFMRMRVDANYDYQAHASGELSTQEYLEQSRGLVGQLSEYYRDTLSTRYGASALRFDSPESHVRSVVEACVETGAKGSLQKVGSYAQHLGVDFDPKGYHSDPEQDTNSYRDHGQTLHSREQDEGVMVATAVKSFGTGVAGAFSQRGVKTLRNQELKSVLELTYPVTQSVLQSKHDPQEAQQKYDLMMGPARSLWSGKEISKTNGSWDVVRDEDGNERAADPKTWTKRFEQFYSDPQGLNVTAGSEHVGRVAAALTDPESGRMLDLSDDQGLEKAGKQGALMDRLTYNREGTAFNELVQAARERRNVFAGEYNSQFAPYKVRDNAREMVKQAEGEIALDPEQWGAKDREIDPLSQRDVLTVEDPRSKARGRPAPRRSATKSEAEAEMDARFAQDAQLAGAATTELS